MAASASDKFQLISASGTVPNVPRVTATRSAAGTSLTVDNCNWDTTTGKIFSTYQVNTSGDVVAGTQTIWKGVVNSSTSIGSLTRLAGASDTGNAIGDYVEIIPDSEWVNMLISGILTQHNQDGTHGNITATGLTVNGAFAVNGTWDGWVGVSDSWSYGSASSPEFTITVPAGATSLYQAGDRIKLTQTTVKYFIITKVASTTLTVYGGTDYTLANAAISSIYISRLKAPFGFPLDPAKWTNSISVTGTYAKSSPTNGVWYGDTGLSATGPSISLPIGVWDLYYSCVIDETNSGGATGDVSVTLSTASNSASDSDFTSNAKASATNINMRSSHSRRKIVSVANATTYYMNIRTDSGSVSNIQIIGTVTAATPARITAVCAYL